MALKKAGQPIRWKERIGTLFIGHIVNFVMVYGYEFIVYPWLIATFGLVRGWTYASIGSAVLCLGTLWFYDATKKDWLGLETVKIIRDGQANGRIGRFFQNIAQRGDTLAFFLLCLKYDPFIITVYMRKGSWNNTMSTRDWKIFWASMVICNAWWGLLVFGAIEAFRKWMAPFVNPLTNWLGLA